MVIAIKGTLEFITAISYRCPLILGCTVQCKIVGQYILIQDDIVSQLVVLALCQCTVGIGELSQISQLGTVVNQVGIIFRTLALCKLGCDVTFPYVWESGVTMEGCRYGNREVRHGKRPDTFGLFGQRKHLSCSVVEYCQRTVFQQHTTTEVYLQIYRFSCVGTTCGFADFLAIELAVVAHAAATGIGQRADIHVVTGQCKLNSLANLRQTGDVGIITKTISERFSQQVSKCLSLHLRG